MVPVLFDALEFLHQLVVTPTHTYKIRHDAVVNHAFSVIFPIMRSYVVYYDGDDSSMIACRSRRRRRCYCCCCCCRRSGRTMMIVLLIVIALMRADPSDSKRTDTAIPAVVRRQDVGTKFWSHNLSGLFRTIPAISHKRQRALSRNVHLKDTPIIQEVSVKAAKPTKDKEKSIKFQIPPKSYQFLLGITPQTIPSLSSTSKQISPIKPRRLDLREGMAEALNELRSLRSEMEQMRKELANLKQLQYGGTTNLEDGSDVDSDVDSIQMRQKRMREFEKVAHDVEQWAENILFPSSLSTDDGDEDTAAGWTEVPCHKMFKQKFNRNGSTRAYIKWMKDSRGSSYITKSTVPTKDGKSEKEPEWPCLRLYSIIDAPCYEVCTYLAQEQHVGEYNQLLDQHKDIDTITSHSKICWARSPQLLFIKPRDFISFCSHRWKHDGTQIVINQACDSYNEKTATAFALRGATYISPDPDDPDGRTRIAMLAHASPGKDIPQWACRTAIQSLVPIEPYRLFHKINEGVKQCRPELQELFTRQQQQQENYEGTHVTEMVGNNTGRGGSTSRSPAGLAQMGFACFWPNGGGEKEVGSNFGTTAKIPCSDNEVNASVNDDEQISSIANPPDDALGEYQ
jgi:hypothetical protein